MCDSTPPPHPLLHESIWFKQNSYEDAEAVYHKRTHGDDQSDEDLEANEKVKPSQHPFLDDVVWMKKNLYEDAEAVYHKRPASTSTKSGTGTGATKSVKPCQHPLLAESVWLKQNEYESAEAAYHKASLTLTNSPIGKTSKKSKDKNGRQNEQKKNVSQKNDLPWSQKLGNKLLTIEQHSKELEGVVNQLKKTQETTQHLMIELSTAMDDCARRVADGLYANQCCISNVKKLHQNLHSAVGTIKKSMATKDHNSYKTHETFCQAMTDRLTALEDEMACLRRAGKDLYDPHWAQHIQSIVSDMGQLHLKINTAEVKSSESKVALMLTQLDGLLKKKKIGSKNSSTKLPAQNELRSPATVSVESMDDISSSLSGECSDFAEDIDDIEEDIALSKSSEKNKKSKTAGKNAATAARTPANKKSNRNRKTGGVTYKQLQGKMNGSSSSSKSNAEEAKKLPKSASHGNHLGKSPKSHFEESSPPQAMKSKTFHNRISRSPLSSSESSSGVFSSPSFALNSPQASSSASSIFDDDGSMAASLLFSIKLTHNPPVIDQNLLLLEYQLSEMAFKVDEMSKASPFTRELKLMMQEISDLRNFALERYQGMHQEQFKQRFQILLTAFNQYDEMILGPKRRQQLKKASPSKSQTQSKAQPSARFKDMQQRREEQKPQEKKTASQSHKSSSNTKGTPSTKKPHRELNQAIANLPGAVNKITEKEKEKASSKETKESPKKMKEKADPKQIEPKSAKGGVTVVPRPSSNVVQIASFSPQLKGDKRKGGISSMVVLDDMSCLLIADIINSSLKLYKFTESEASQNLDFKFVNSFELRNPFYMAQFTYNRVAVTGNGCLINIVQVSERSIRIINSLETTVQYYGVAYVAKNTLVAAAYEADTIDLLKFDRDRAIQRTTLAHSNGPELLSTIPSRNSVLFFDKQHDGRYHLKSVNLRGEVVFNVVLEEGRPGDVWNLSCMGEKILCCNKQQNTLALYSHTGEKDGFLVAPQLTVNLPFAVAFNKQGLLFLANDGAWEKDANHYITTEVNAFSFTNN